MKLSYHFKHKQTQKTTLHFYVHPGNVIIYPATSVFNLVEHSLEMKQAFNRFHKSV